MRSRSDRGAVAVEFAIIAPLLLLVIFMIFDAGRYWFVQISLVNASSQAARTLASGGTVVAAKSAIAQSAASAQSLAKAATLTTSASVCTLSSGEKWAQATASLDFHFLSPVGLFLKINPNSTQSEYITVSSTSKWICP